jgi:hypothetical protein
MEIIFTLNFIIVIVYYNRSKNVYNGSRNRSVGIVTGYGLKDEGVGVRVLIWSRIFS